MLLFGLWGLDLAVSVGVVSVSLEAAGFGEATFSEYRPRRPTSEIRRLRLQFRVRVRVRVWVKAMVRVRSGLRLGFRLGLNKGYG